MLTLQNYVGNVQRNLCRSSLSSALLQMANLQPRASPLISLRDMEARSQEPEGRMRDGRLNRMGLPTQREQNFRYGPYKGTNQRLVRQLSTGRAQHIGGKLPAPGLRREEHRVDDGRGFGGIFQRHRDLAALANGAREQVALDGVLVAGRQLLDGESAAVEVAAIVDKHARSPSGRGVEGNLRLDSSGAPEEAHALLARDLGAAGEYAVAGREFQDGRRQHVDVAEARVARDGGRNAHRLLAEDHAGRFDSIAADIE